jgi:hypothetical protein
VSISFTPGRDFEAAGAADHEIAGNAGFPHRRDQFVRVAGGEMHRADHDVVALDNCGEAGDVIRIGLHGHDARQCRDFLRMAGDRGHAMAAARQFGEDARAGIAGGADQGDFHGGSISLGGLMWYLSDTN